MVSVETVRLCTGDVRSKEDRPIFSVLVARATAHRRRGWCGDPRSSLLKKKERDVEAGEVESRFWYKEGEGEMCVHVRGMKRFSCVSIT